VIDSEKAAANRKAREERKKAHLRAIMDRHTEHFRAIGVQHPVSVARETHAAIGAVLERDRNRDPASNGVRCRKGCSHCCHGPVDIWPQEAALLVEVVRASGVDIDRARLERQSGQTVDTWRKQPEADRACVFLGGDGACRVYESRPNACRKLLVTSDPERCDQEKHAPESVERWFSWEAEIMESAALETFGGSLLPTAVLAELRKRQPL
jgi:Fe-S-cluster containining protein